MPVRRGRKPAYAPKDDGILYIGEEPPGVSFPDLCKHPPEAKSESEDEGEEEVSERKPSEIEYEIEEVRDFNEKEQLCLVKWKDYPEEDNTWEPLKNIGLYELNLYRHRKREETGENKAISVKFNEILSEVNASGGIIIPSSIAPNRRGRPRKSEEHSPSPRERNLRGRRKDM